MLGVLEGFAIIGVVIAVGYLIGRFQLLGSNAEQVQYVLSRIVFFHMRRLPTKFARLKERLYFFLLHNWLQNYNFSAQDNEVAAPCRFWTQEFLSPTDAHLVSLRHLIRERSRDAVRRRSAAQREGATV